MCYLVCFFNCSVNRNEVIIESANFGWQIVLNSFCAIDTFYLIGYAHTFCIISLFFCDINGRINNGHEVTN